MKNIESQSFKTPETETDIESVAETTAIRLGIRPQIHEKIDNLASELDKNLERFMDGESGGDKIVELMYMSDDWVFYSEFKHTLEKFDELEKKYPGKIGEACKRDRQANPIEELRRYTLEFEKPLQEIHKSKQKSLGSKGHSTGRSAEEYKDLLGLSEDDIRGKAILDIGAGKGNFVKYAAEQEAGLSVGIDVASYSRASQKSPENPNGMVLPAEWYSLPFEDEKFDRVVSLFAFPFWVKSWDEVKRGFQEIIRVTKRGGEINIMPAAPVQEKRDVKKKTWAEWIKNGLDGLYMLDCIHRREFEEILLNFKDEIEIEVDRPRADLANSSQVTFFNLKLKRKQRSAE